MAGLRVMQSFRAPRPTTNPYVTMLDQALAQTPELQHLRFQWREAIVGRYDVFHWHWPEGKLHGSTWWKSLGKFLLTVALSARHKMSRRIAVVRTVHNIKLPDDNAVRRMLLKQIDRQTLYRITLNATTELKADQPYSLILHGHYRDWYSSCPRSEPIAGRLATFGGMRRYKSVAALIDAYAAAIVDEPTLSLMIGGRPSSPDIAADLNNRAAFLQGVELKLSFLTDRELVQLATSAELIVLAYSFMHNSGSVLAALSLDRPVMVPRNDANEALAEEVGADWVLMYEGKLDGEKLKLAWSKSLVTLTRGRPDLSAREWAGTGQAHLEASRAAVALKRGLPPPSSIEGSPTPGSKSSS